MIASSIAWLGMVGVTVEVVVETLDGECFVEFLSRDERFQVGVNTG